MNDAGPRERRLRRPACRREAISGRGAAYGRGRRSGAARALSMSRCATATSRSSLVAVARGEVLGDRDRAVAPAGAADRDHQVRLALGDVLRQQEVEQRVQALVELLQAPVAADVLDDRWSRPVSSRSSGS